MSDLSANPPPMRRPRERALADRFIHDPITEIVLVVLIVTSAALLLGEAAFEHHGRIQHLMRIAGDALNWVFVGELAIRFWVAPKKKRFFRRFWLDLLAIVPVLHPFGMIRVFRLLRLLRAGLLLNRRLAVFRGVFQGAGLEFTVLATMTVILVLAGAVTLHFGERGVNPDFAGMKQTVWYSLLTLVSEQPTVGEPRTDLGWAVTLVLILGGTTVFGMFVGTVSASMVARWSNRLEASDVDPDDLNDHILICGWNHSAPVVLREVLNPAAGLRPVVILTEGEKMPPDAKVANVPNGLLFHVSGDYTRVEVLEQAAVARASMAILLSDRTVERSNHDRDARTVLAALTIERIAPGIFTCAELKDRQHETLLRRAGVEEIIVSDEYSGYLLGSVGRTHGLVSTLDEILSTRYGNAFHKVAVPRSLHGRTVGELHSMLKERFNAVLVSLETYREGRRRVQVNPESSVEVFGGDNLVVIATEPFSL